ISQAVAEAQATQRQQCFLQFGTWQTQCCEIDVVGSVDTVLQEQGFAPGNDLATGAQAQGTTKQVNVCPDVSIKQTEAASRIILGIFGEAVANAVVCMVRVRRVAV